MFGPALKNSILDFNFNSSKQCFDECYKTKNCTHFSWHTNAENVSQISCQILTPIVKEKNKAKVIHYFCEKEGSTIRRREFLCQKSTDNHEPWVVTKVRIFLLFSQLSTSQILSPMSSWDNNHFSFLFIWNLDTKIFFFFAL